MFHKALQQARDTDRAWITKSLALSFADINKKIESLQVELHAQKTTALDNLADTHAALNEVGNEIDLLVGTLAALEDKVTVLDEMNDRELDDLEERIKDLEEKS